ncbi:hypothetical protein [Nocardia bovistercoris]|uniref:Uncharacterized protein n=1 Tax=Nocardia bovistercoris TaxID=2785916 RepID=A0A931IFJ6_9NOCA|nr:hypothetical protein [Nocardia bovistercoris]MBH0779430.1 hypothetical protein [Nocardia bovistercoris]
MLSVVAAGAITGCDSGTESVPTIPTEAADPSCYQAAHVGSATIADPEFAMFAEGLRLPSRARVITGRMNTAEHNPGEVVLALDICIPDSADVAGLVPVATYIARALKPSPLGARTAALYVADVGPQIEEQAKIRDATFRTRPWSGAPSEEVGAWEVVVE